MDSISNILISDRIYRILRIFFLFVLISHLPAIVSRHVRHRLRLRQCRAGSGEAGGDENENTQSAYGGKLLG